MVNCDYYLAILGCRSPIFWNEPFEFLSDDSFSDAEKVASKFWFLSFEMIIRTYFRKIALFPWIQSW